MDVVKVPKVTTFDSCFKSEVVEFGYNNDIASPVHDVCATTVDTNIMAGVILNNVMSCQMELDTAACKSMIPYVS